MRPPAGVLYDNIHTKLFTLPDDTLVLPGMCDISNQLSSWLMYPTVEEAHVDRQGCGWALIASPSTCPPMSGASKAEHGA